MSGGLPGGVLVEELTASVAAGRALVQALETCTGREDARRLVEVASAGMPGGVWEAGDGRRGGPEVVVTGDLKAGRSTLLNGLLGHPVLSTAVRTCTPVPTSVFARGAWWTEVPPSKVDGRRRGDGRVVVVDVRQPLPRAVRLAACDGPTVVVCTKADRALEDAVLSTDPEDELRLARRVARRRVAERVGEVAAWIDCDPRDCADLEARVVPVLKMALAPAFLASVDRRAKAGDRVWLRWVDGRLGAERAPLPDAVDVGLLAVELCRTELVICLATLEADLGAVDVRLGACDSHDALDSLAGAVPTLLAEAVLQATRAVTAHRQAHWAGSVITVASRVMGAWRAHVGLPANGGSTDVVKSAQPPGFGADLPVRRWRSEAAQLEAHGLLSRATRRLRSIERRRADLQGGWRALSAELVQVVGDAAWQERWRVEAALADVAADRMALMDVSAADALRLADLLADVHKAAIHRLHQLS